jgi:hypothetical protein
MLIKVGNKIFNVDNINFVVYTPSATNKESRLQIMFAGYQWDDNRSFQQLNGAEADSFWTKINTQDPI